MTEHFVIVGAQRSGTTYLYRLLEQHPQICMARPMRPEPKYFLSEDESSLEYDQYLETCFGHRSTERVLGEKSTSYIERLDCIERIRKLLPRARILFVLRDPALRAYSNWRFSRAHGIEPMDFVDALEAEPRRTLDWARDRFSVCPYAYAGRGDYASYLKKWAAVFPRQQIDVITSEALTRDPRVLDAVLGRLGLEAGASLVSPGIVNSTADEFDGPMSDEVKQMLRRRYRDGSAELASEWGLDVSHWSP